MPRARACAGRRAASTRRACRRSCHRVVTERAGAGPRLVFAQLSRRDFRPAEYGVPRRDPRAHDQRVPREARASASGAHRATGGFVAAARRARHCSEWRCVRGRRAEVGRLRAAAAVGRAVHHLHVRNYRTVEGRPVAVPAALHYGDRRLRLSARRRGHPREPADVPRRRHELADDRADPLGLVPSRRRLQHRSLLGPGPPRQLRDDVGADRHHGCVSHEIAATPGRSRASDSLHDRLSRERADGAHSRPLRHRLSHRLQHDGVVGAARQRAELERVRRVRQAPQRRGVSTGRRARHRSAGRHARRADRTQRAALDLQSRLRRLARGHRACVAQWLVPHRRHPAQGRWRQLFLRRPSEGRNPPPRRKHLVARSRGGSPHAPGRRRSHRRRYSRRVGRRSDGRNRREARPGARAVR